jgi:hypothetical protein
MGTTVNVLRPQEKSVIRLQFAVAAALLVHLWGCSARNEPQLEIWQDGAFVPVVVRSYEIGGKRSGATTRAVAVVTTDENERLELTLEISYDPTPVLSQGSWSSSTEGGGEVHAESVEFTGGQGEGPSVGGVFVLKQQDAPRFRLKLPLRPVSTPQWKTN